MNRSVLRTTNGPAFLATFVGAGLLLGLPSADATEGGGTSYPLGVNTVISGKMPPPGLTEFFYLSDYRADQTVDSDGHSKAGIHDFDLHIQALSIRLDYVFEDYTLFGAKVATRMALPLVKGDISFNVDTPAGRIRRSETQDGVGDLTLVPLILGWSSPRFNQLVGIDLFVPTGSYDKDRLFNPGRNNWAYGPWYSFTAYPFEQLEVSSKMIYLVNEGNSATHYRSGNEFNADYNIGFNITREWQVGVNGYLYKQLGDDEQRGDTVGDGNRGRAVAFGPSIKYQTPQIGLVLKWQHETLVENRAKGDRIWAQAVYRF